MNIGIISQNTNQSNNSVAFKQFLGVTCKKGFENKKVVSAIEEGIEKLQENNPKIRDLFTKNDISISLEDTFKKKHKIYQRYFGSTCTISSKPAKNGNALHDFFCTICPKERISFQSENGYSFRDAEEGLLNRISLFKQDLIDNFSR